MPPTLRSAKNGKNNGDENKPNGNRKASRPPLKKKRTKTDQDTRKPQEKQSTKETGAESSEKPLVEYFSESTCPVCLENLMFFSPVSGRQVTSTTCGHVFCYSCIVDCLNHTGLCPKCNNPQTREKIHPILLIQTVM